MSRTGQWLVWITLTLLVAFSVLNWTALTTPASLDLLVTRVYAAPGLVLLSLTAVFVVLFVLTQVGGMMESRRLHKKLESAREVAEVAEKSRLDELRTLLTSGLDKLNERLDRLESAGRKAEAAPPKSKAESKRDEYIQKIKAKIEEWNSDLAELESRAEAAEDDLKAGYRKQIESLKQQRKEAARKLDELQSASEEAWENLKEGVEGAWEKMNQAFRKAAASFK